MLVLFQCKCKKCGHKWVSVGEEPPVRCAKCKTPYWNKPRRKRRNSE